jgi:hypothetical protein
MRRREIARSQCEFTPVDVEVGLTFDVVFGVFAAAMAVIAVLAIRWAVGRDREEKRMRGQALDEGRSDP